MARNTLRIQADLDDFYDALRVLSGPGPETVAALDGVLSKGLAETQARVHVITSSLKRSGRTETTRDDDSWDGSIVYGGPSPGSVNDPVEYAEYERQRGGTHDYLSNLPLLHSDFEDALYASVRAHP